MWGEKKSEVMKRGKRRQNRESGIELIPELRLELSFLMSAISLMRRS